MVIHNSLTKTKEEFKPIKDGEVKMYACGITVYDDCHIGHAKQYVTFDMIRNYLEYKGYKVTYVRNYTDVDDKIIARSNELNINPLIYASERINEVERVMNLLDVRDADIKPKATENIKNIIEFVSKLIEKGYAYATPKGDVYYRVRNFKEYGKLSKRNADDMQNGVRKELEEGKEDPLDFALWKSAKPNEIFWESPWGNGRPGWHIECSAMNYRYLGEQIDIHGGGKDLIFPHHENEIAQSEALTGKPFANYWIHNGLITVNGQKMSKSLGNSLTVKDVLNKYNKEVVKYMLLKNHYASSVDLNDQEFLQAEKHMYYFYKTFDDIDTFISKFDIDLNLEDEEVMKLPIENNPYEEFRIKFEEAMDDDFNNALAYANLFEIMKYINNLLANKKIEDNSKAKLLYALKNRIIKLYNILSNFKQEPKEFMKELKNKYLSKLDITENEILEKINERKLAKEQKDYTKADEIRNTLDEKGIVLLDSKEGTDWNIKALS